MKNYIDKVLVLIAGLFILGAPVLQDVHAAGNVGSASSTTSQNIGSTAFYSNKRTSKPVSIEVGRPQILDADEGAFIWLDTNGFWHIEWQGKEGQVVWFRVISDGEFEVISSTGNKTRSEIDIKSRLVIYGGLSEVKSELVFSSKANSIELQGKWNFGNIANHLFISKSKFNSPYHIVNLVNSSNE